MIRDSSITDVRLESRAENKSSLSVESGSSGAGHSRGMAWTPPASVEGSTPTWTEGTPSFTESSSSGDMGEFGCSRRACHLPIYSTYNIIVCYFIRKPRCNSNLPVYFQIHVPLLKQDIHKYMYVVVVQFSDILFLFNFVLCVSMYTPCSLSLSLSL